MLTTILNVSEARHRLTELVRDLDKPVCITVHGKPRAVLVRYDMFQDLLEKIEDLEDSLDAVLRKDEPTLDFDEVMAELEGVPTPA